MVEHLTFDTFKTKIFDFEKHNDWQYNGPRPALVDFYASWCGPCKTLAPVLEELKEEYDGKVDIYKVDTEKEQELAQIFGVRSIPTLLFVPMEGKPQVAHGALPRAELERAFREVLQIK